MLNSDFVKLAEVLDKLCVEGYNTIDKVDIFECLVNDFNLEWNNEVLDNAINLLCENKFIIVKYADDLALCLTFTEVGRELVNRIKIAKQNQEQSQKTKKLKSRNENRKTDNSVALTSDLTIPQGQNEIMAKLAPEEKKEKSNKLIVFLIGLAGGILGGGITGTIITLLVLLL